MLRTNLPNTHITCLRKGRVQVTLDVWQTRYSQTKLCGNMDIATYSFPFFLRQLCWIKVNLWQTPFYILCRIPACFEALFEVRKAFLWFFTLISKRLFKGNLIASPLIKPRFTHRGWYEVKCVFWNGGLLLGKALTICYPNCKQREDLTNVL